MICLMCFQELGSPLGRFVRNEDMLKTASPVVVRATYTIKSF